MADQDWQAVDTPSHPLLPGDRWVAVKAEIRLNATGEVRDCSTEGIILAGDQNPVTYIWEEGNFSCDCNRAIFFGAKGADGPNSRCGEGAFSVRLRNAKTGAIFYDEFDNEVSRG